MEISKLESILKSKLKDDELVVHHIDNQKGQIILKILSPKRFLLYLIDQKKFEETDMKEEISELIKELK